MVRLSCWSTIRFAKEGSPTYQRSDAATAHPFSLAGGGQVHRDGPPNLSPRHWFASVMSTELTKATWRTQVAIGPRTADVRPTVCARTSLYDEQSGRRTGRTPLHARSSVSRVSQPVVAKQGALFLLSADNGDIEEHTDQGLYFHDMRHLSAYTLHLNGQLPVVLLADASEGNRELFEFDEPRHLRRGR